MATRFSSAQINLSNQLGRDVENQRVFIQHEKQQTSKDTKIKQQSSIQNNQKYWEQKETPTQEQEQLLNQNVPYTQSLADKNLDLFTQFQRFLQENNIHTNSQQTSWGAQVNQTSHSTVHNTQMLPSTLPNAALNPPPQAQESLITTTSIINLQQPSFWTTRPELWFAILEAQFARYGIVDEPSRLHQLMRNLSEELITLEMEGIINSAPSHSIYTQVKQALLKSHSFTGEQKVRKLISDLHFEGDKPSNFLRHMQRFANNQVSTTVVRQIWLDRLPKELRIALVASEHLPDEQLAHAADRIYALQNSNYKPQICA